MLSESNPFTIGVVGAGQIAASTHLPLLSNADWADIKYVADVDRWQVRKLARSYDTESILIGDDLSELPSSDIALLATPVGVREGYIKEFGQRSTPVFSEKPFAPDLETHREFLDVLDQVSCNYLRLSYSATRIMRRLVENQAFGAVKRVECVEGGIVGATGRSQTTYQIDDTLVGGGVLMERGPHILSQLLFILQPVTVGVEDATVVSDEGFDVDINASLVADTDAGKIPVAFGLTRIRPVDTRLRAVFENAAATFTIDDPGTTIRVEVDGTSVAELTSDDRWATTFAQSAYLRWRQFLSKITGDDEYPETIATGLEVTQLIADIYEAAEVESL